MSSYISKIDNSELLLLPLVGFGGEVVVVDTLSKMQEAYDVLCCHSILGFDTETKPSFSKNIHHTVSLLQLSTFDVAYLFRLNCVELSDDILGLLSNDSILKVGAAIRDDLRGLRGLSDFVPGGFIDLQSIVFRWGIEELSVRKLAAIVLGIRISKAQRLSNWEVCELSVSQCNYAAMDAWVCREIYCKLFGV